MNLNKKILLYLGGIVLILSIYFGLFFYIIVISSVQSIEKDQVYKGMERAKSALSSSLIDIDNQATSWAEWNETYNFGYGQNEAFINNYLNYENLSDINIDVVGFINSNDQVTVSREFDKKTKEFIESTDPNKKNIIDTHTVLNENKRSYGLVSFSNMPMLISFQAVKKGDGTGISPGVLFMGRVINDDLLMAFSGLTQAEIEVKLISNATEKEDEYVEAIKFLDKNEEIFIKKEGNNIAGFSYFKDITQKPIVIAEIEMPRDIFTNTIKNYIFFLLSSVMGMAVAASIMYYFIKTKIIDRIINLSQFIAVNTHDQTFSARVKVEGYDEISDLEKNINTIIDTAENCKK